MPNQTKDERMSNPNWMEDKYEKKFHNSKPKFPLLWFFDKHLWTHLLSCTCSCACNPFPTMNNTFYNNNKEKTFHCRQLKRNEINTENQMRSIAVKWQFFCFFCNSDRFFLSFHSLSLFSSVLFTLILFFYSLCNGYILTP